MMLVIIENFTVPPVPVRFYPFEFHGFGSGSGSQEMKYSGFGSVFGSKNCGTAGLY
jgi:hypothetical protein